MDNSFPDLKANYTVQNDIFLQEDFSTLDKLTQSYLLLKKRICGTDELIKQYNDKVKECEKLKHDLDITKKQNKTLTCNYNSSLAKVIKLELQNGDYKRDIQSFQTQVNEHTTKIAADQQHIQQLICKIKDLERNENDKSMQYDLEKYSFQVKIKELEAELKTAKKLYDAKTTKMEKKKVPTKDNNKVNSRDVGTNTTLIKDVIIEKPQVTDKSILTDEFYDVRDNPYPLFCAKCEVLVEPVRPEQICNIMTSSCPKLIQRISSPWKKSPSPPPMPSKNNEELKKESLPPPPDITPPLQLQNQTNSANFISTDLLAVSLNRSDCCDNYSRTPILMNQDSYYIGSTPINPPPMRSNNSANQNNRCENIETIASSLSIISSLQKRIDTLEATVKKKLNKRLAEQKNSCCQHHHANSDHSYNRSKPMEFEFMDMWERMANFYENRSRKCKLSRLKSRVQRIKNLHRGGWKIDSVAKSVDQNSLRIKSKKYKYRYSPLYNESETRSNSIESFDKLDSDSGGNSVNDMFNDSDDSKIDLNLNSKVISHLETDSSESHKTDLNGTDAAEAQNSSDCIKLTGCESDSGIFSDSVESGKLQQLETDVTICSELEEHKKVTRSRSSVKKELFVTETQKCKPGMKSPMKVASDLMTSDKLTGTNFTSKSLQRSNEHSDEVEQIPEVSRRSSTAAEVETDPLNTSTSPKKRRVNDPQESKKSNTREALLKKLRKLKKNKAPVKSCQNVPERQDVQQRNNENLDHTQKQRVVERNTGLNKADDYVPNKKPRIAHVPRSAIIVDKKPLKENLQFKKRVPRKIQRTIPQKLTDNSVDLDVSSKDHYEPQEISNPKIVADAIIDMVPIDGHPDIKSSVSDTSDEVLESNERKTELVNGIEISEKQDRETNCLDVSVNSEVDNTNQPENEGSIETQETNLSIEKRFNTEGLPEIACSQEEDSNEEGLNLYRPLTRLELYIKESTPTTKISKRQRQKRLQILRTAERFVQKQLQRLIDSEWDTSVHYDVLEKLASTCGTRVIAKGIVDFLSTEKECSKSVDSTYTPPAPPMTKSQQKIVALLVDLEEAKPTVFELVQTGIEYRLFKLTQNLQRDVIESLSRLYTILARIRKDRDRVRIFCCDALYCFGLHAIIALYTVLICWPEIFPHNETNKELLPKCMAHLLLTQKATDYSKLSALKSLLSAFYKYPTGTLSTDLLNELLAKFQEQPDTGVETALLILAKREGTKWTYKNIIKGALLPMIINNKLTNTYRAFSLLGNFLRVFPIEDKDKSVGEIVNQLCDLINSDEGTDEQKEGVVSALISLSRLKFDQTVQNILTWVPSAPLQSRTIQQMDGLFSSKSAQFWRNQLKKKKKLTHIQNRRKT